MFPSFLFGKGKGEFEFGTKIVATAPATLIGIRYYRDSSETGAHVGRVWSSTGTLIASVVGTTGAAMILIRPLIRANAARLHNVHVVVFFIILVANVGGALSPLGDPPLFVGFLRGVDFFWTTRALLAPQAWVLRGRGAGPRKSPRGSRSRPDRHQ